MDTAKKKASARYKRQRRVRKNVIGTTDRPRLSVFRSARHIYAQIIDDSVGKTLAASGSTEKVIMGDKEIGDKSAIAKAVGKLVAERAKEKGIKTVVFDRNGFLYHGRIKAVSEGAREAGLDF